MGKAGIKEWYKNIVLKGDEYLLDRLGRRGYLAVWDIHIPDAPDIDEIDIFAIYRGESDPDAKLKELPEQDAGSIRIFVDELYDSGGYHKQVNQLFGSPEDTVRKPRTGFRALCSQFRGTGGEWTRLQGHGYLPTENDSDDENAFGEHRRLMADMERKVKSVFDVSKNQNWARTERDIAFGEGKDGQRIVFISCQTHVSRPMFKSFEEHRDRFPFVLTDNFVAGFRQLEETYRPLRTENNWKQIICLQYYHASLNLFADFLSRHVSEYVEREELALDPRSSKLQDWHLYRIMDDAVLYKKVAHIGADLVAMLESLLDLNKALTSHESQKDQLSALAAELHGCCKDVRQLLSRPTDALQESLKYLDLSRSMKETKSVQKLTVLATIFLPPSLAAGILSMQSRFKDLGEVLYDFFGVVVLLGFIAVVLLVLFAILTALREGESMLRGVKIYAWYIRPLLEISGAVILSTYFCLVLSSFLVGMFKDVVLGAKILGYGTVAASFGPTTLTAVIAILVLLLKHIIGWVKACMSNFRKQKQLNLEDGPVRDDRNEVKKEESEVGGTEVKTKSKIDEQEGRTDIPSDNCSTRPRVQHESTRSTHPATDGSGITHALAMSGILDTGIPSGIAGARIRRARRL